MQSTVKSALLSLAIIASPLAIADSVRNNSQESSKRTAEALTEQSEQQLDHFFHRLAGENRFLGTAVIYQDTTPVYQITIQPSKKAKKGWRTSVDHDLKYKIGSISKTYAATIIFQLIEEGKITLDTKLSKFYPKVKNADKITIKHLLNHQSGIFNYTGEPDFINYVFLPKDKDFLVKRIESFDSVFEPGEKAEYSNSGYLLLGFIAEDIENKSYAKIVEERISQPYDLNDTYYGSTINNKNGEVDSFEYKGKWGKMAQWNMNIPGAAGALVSNADDLNKFFNLLFDGTIISEQSLQTMTSMDMKYGLGIFETSYGEEDNKLKGYWHNGGIEAFRTHLAHYPDKDLTVVLLSNGLRYDMREIYEAMLDAYHGKTVEEPEFGEPIDLTEDQLAPLVGNYSSDTFPLDIKLSVKDGQLYAQATGQGEFPLTAYPDDKFEYIEAGIEMRFDRDIDQFVLIQGGQGYAFTKEGAKKHKGFEVPETVLEQYVGVYGADDFPLDLEISTKEGNLYGQATGQPEFPLTAESESRFRFKLAGIVINFEADKNQLTITQHGKDTVLTKSK
ncbi:serine hydrolase domain-containing protein [Kangiella sp.]|uniref:serine hydrolase domain-containing protein n=1 Tax=Kangiella sp. TaxID=1920245 RepID=UPI003A908609